MELAIVSVIKAPLQRLRKGIETHLINTRYGGLLLYGAAILLLAFVIYYFSNISGFKLCAINFQSERPGLNNVTLQPDRVFSSASKSVYAIVSGHRIRITSYIYSDANKTRIELQKRGRSGAMVGWYTELDGELFCRGPGICPPMMSSGDYIGIPTVTDVLLLWTNEEVLNLQVVRYTIFHLPTLEERAQDRFTIDSTFVFCTQVKVVWGQVIEHSCHSLFIVLAAAVIDFVLLLSLAYQLCTQTLRHPLRYSIQSLPLPGLKSDQNHQAMNSVPSSCDGSDVGGDSPKITRLLKIPDDIRSSCESLVSTKSEKGQSGISHMVYPRHNCRNTTSSGRSSDVTSSASSSDDDSNHLSRMQQESTTNIPPPHYARRGPRTVYEITVPRPPPEGFESSP